MVSILFINYGRPHEYGTLADINGSMRIEEIAVVAKVWEMSAVSLNNNQHIVLHPQSIQAPLERV